MALNLELWKDSVKNLAQCLVSTTRIILYIAFPQASSNLGLFYCCTGFIIRQMLNLFILLLLFGFFLAMPCGMWDLSSPTRDQTCVLCRGSMESLQLDHLGSPFLRCLECRFQSPRAWDSIPAPSLTSCIIMGRNFN